MSTIFQRTCIFEEISVPLAALPRIGLGTVFNIVSFIFWPQFLTFDLASAPINLILSAVHNFTALVL
jgi:hypothetical protein